MPAADPVTRFSNRVADYVRSRPSYPAEVLTILREEASLNPTSNVADVGSGTGLSAGLFLRNGNRVFGIEPNDAMRQAAESLLAEYPAFHSVVGTAEATNLPDRSVDLVVAGQAFHWFDPLLARTEFDRILKPGGFVVLMWNTLREEATPFLREYSALLREYGTDYREVVHTNLGREALRGFYGTEPQYWQLANAQTFDRAGLHSRLRSSSYTPPVGHPHYSPMLAELDRIFDRCQDADRVEFLYTTELYLGRLAPA